MSPMPITADLAIKGIKDKTLSVRDLTCDVRREIVERMTLQGWSQGRIKDFLGVSAHTVWKDVQAIKREMAGQITDLDVKEIAGVHLRRLEVQAQRLIAKSHEPGVSAADFRGLITDAVKTWRAAIEDLQGLGFVAKAPDRVEVKGVAAFAGMSEDELREENRRIFDADFSIPGNADDASATPPGCGGCGEEPAGLLPDVPPGAVSLPDGAIPDGDDGPGGSPDGGSP